MKKLLLLVGLLVPAALSASKIFVERQTYQTYELTAGTFNTIPLGDGIELRVIDKGNLEISVFQLSIARLNSEATGYVTLCESQLEVPFGSEATLVFSKRGVRGRFVASVHDAVITPEPDPDETSNPIISESTSADPILG